MVKYACLRSPIVLSSVCIDEALTQFTGWMKKNSSKNPISPYLRETFYKAVMRTSEENKAVLRGSEESKNIIEFFLGKYEEAKILRFRHLEHFQQLHRAYIDYTFVIMDLYKTRSPQGEEKDTLGFEMDLDTLCSIVENDKYSSDTSDIGIQVLKRGLGKRLPLASPGTNVQKSVDRH